MKTFFADVSGRCPNMGRILPERLAANCSLGELFPMGLAALAILLLKRHYSLASATQLDWILAPTAKLVSWFTSAHLTAEMGVGYVDFSKGIIVAPACAGVNFMLMAFGLTAFFGLRHIRGLTGRLAWLPAALAAAYGLTLIVNTVRIALSMTLYDADIYTGPLTVARVHRLAGVGLYFSSLWLYFLGLRHAAAVYCRRFVLQTNLKRPQESSWWVWSWYLLVAIAAPLANAAWRNGSATFAEHCVTVLVTCGVFAALSIGISRSWKILYRRPSKWAGT